MADKDWEWEALDAYGFTRGINEMWDTKLLEMLEAMVDAFLVSCKFIYKTCRHDLALYWSLWPNERC